MAYSKLLGKKYIKTKHGFLFDNGVMISFAEAKEKPESIIRTFTERSTNGPWYDYTYAVTTGAVRKRRSDRKVKPKDELAEPPKELVAEAEDTLDETPVPYSIQIIRIIFLLLGIGTITLSAVYTYNFLLTTNTSFVAVVLSVSMIVFSVMASTMVILFLNQRHYALAALFSILWVIVVTYSMFSTISVNYAGYSNYEASKISEKQELSGVYAQYVKLTELETRAYESVKTRQEYLNRLQSKESTPAWMISQASSELAKAERLASQYGVSIQELLVKYPDIATFEEASANQARDVYKDIESMTGISAERLFFVLNMLPAIFIDIIAPVSVASATFLGGLYGKKQKRTTARPQKRHGYNYIIEGIKRVYRQGRETMVSFAGRLGKGQGTESDSVSENAQ